MLERILLGNKTLFHRTVIDSSEITHIIGTGIWTNTGSFKPTFIGYHQIGVHGFQRDVCLVIQKAFKTAQGVPIGIGSTYFSYFLQFNQQSFPIQKKGITSFMSRVKFYDAVGCISFIFLFQTVDTFFYFEQICINVLFQCCQIESSLFILSSRNIYSFQNCIPLVRE